MSNTMSNTTTSMQTENTSGRSMAGTMERSMNRVAATLRYDSVFGQPVERGEYTIVPCAEVAIGMGMGGGGGVAPAPADTPASEGIGGTLGSQAPSASQRQSQGEGVGGGGGGQARPVAVIVISRSGVEVQPIVNATRIALTALTTAGIVCACLALSVPRAFRR